MLSSIFNLILDTVAVILGATLLIRFWSQVVRVRPPNQIGQFIFAVTDWLVLPLRRILPGSGGYDWASFIGAILVILVATTIKMALFGSLMLQLIVLASLIRLTEWIIYGFIILILIEAVFSWVNPHAPLAPFVRSLNEPLLRPLRRMVPLIGGIDFSPLVALIGLQIVLMVITGFIQRLA